MNKEKDTVSAACEHISTLLRELSPVVEEKMKVAPFKEQERLRELISNASNFVTSQTGANVPKLKETTVTTKESLKKAQRWAGV